MSATFNQLQGIGAVASKNSASVTVSLLDANDNPIGGERYVGYTSAFDISATTNNIELKNAGQGPNVVVASANTDTTVEVSMTLQDFRIENVADFLFGDFTEVAEEVSKTVTATAKVGKMINLDGFITDDTTSMVVEDTGGAGATYVEGSDYIVEKTGGIFILETGTIADDAELDITYDTVTYNKVEAFTKDNLYLQFIIRGVNSVDKKHFKTTIFKVQANPTDAFSLIDPENFNESTISGTAIASKAVSGAGLSSILKHEVVK